MRMTEVDRHQSRSAGKSYSPMTGQSWFRESVAELIVCGLLVCVTLLSAGWGWMFSIRDRKWAPHLMTHTRHILTLMDPFSSPPLFSPLLSPLLFDTLFLSFKEIKNLLRAKRVSFYDMIMSSCIQLDLGAQTEGLRSAVAFCFGWKRKTNNSMVSKHESLQEKLTKNGNLVYSMSCCYKPRLILGSSVEHKKWF